MARRATPVGLVLIATAADGAGAHGLAFYALLLAVPAAAVAALEAFGQVLDGAGEHLHALLWALLLALVVVGAGGRGGGRGAPPLERSPRRRAEHDRGDSDRRASRRVHEPEGEMPFRQQVACLLGERRDLVCRPHRPDSVRSYALEGERRGG